MQGKGGNERKLLLKVYKIWMMDHLIRLKMKLKCRKLNVNYIGG